MSDRTAGISFNSGTLAPKKYSKYLVTYSVDGLTATYKYYSDNNVLMATVEIECDSCGREIRGELL